MDIGGWDAVLKKAECDQLFYNQQVTMEAPAVEQPEAIDDVQVTVEVQKKPNPVPVKSFYVTGQYGIKTPTSVSTATRKPTDYIAKNNAQNVKQEDALYDESKVIIGAKVSHKMFGTGTIISMDKKKSKIDVKFKVGQKSFVIEKGNKLLDII